MTLLQRFEPLVAMEPSAAVDPRLSDLDFLLQHASLADLARMTRQVMELAETAAQPWRPQHMHEWLT